MATILALDKTGPKWNFGTKLSVREQVAFMPESCPPNDPKVRQPKPIIAPARTRISFIILNAAGSLRSPLFGAQQHTVACPCRTAHPRAAPPRPSPTQARDGPGRRCALS